MIRSSEKYIKQLKKHIIGPKKEKKMFLGMLEERIAVRTEENPDMTYADICEEFGEPKDAASEFVAYSDPERIKKAIRTKRILLCAVIAFIISIVVFWTVVFAGTHKQSHGYIVEYIEDASFDGIPENATITEIESF